MRQAFRFSILSMACLLAFACSFAPKYELPIPPVPKNYKETGAWVENKIRVSQLQSTAWWQVFQDPLLDELEQALKCNNNNLKVSLARFQESLSLARVAQSELYPDI